MALRLTPSRLQKSCHAKCLAIDTHVDSEVTKAETVCLDRCFAKFFVRLPPSPALSCPAFDTRCDAVCARARLTMLAVWAQAVHDAVMKIVQDKQAEDQQRMMGQ